MNQPITIAFVAGRSGGHILPALTLAQQHKHTDANNKILLFSTDTKLDSTIIAQATYDYYVPLALDNVPQKLLGYPRFIFYFLRAFGKSLYHLHTQKPAYVVSMGGYISLPVCLAAWLLQIPIHLFELNVLPGKATSFLLPFATKLLICFPQTADHIPSRYQCTLQPYPLRFTTRHSRKPLSLQEMGLSPDKHTLFITGGSQGSLFINTMIKEWVINNTHLHHTINIIHQTGASNIAEWHTLYNQHAISALVFDYCQDLSPYYQVADLVVCRAGAGTLFECLFFGKQCITIPLETHATSHQVNNAQAMVEKHPQLFTLLYQKDIIACPEKAFELITHQLILTYRSLEHTKQPLQTSNTP